MSRKYPCTGDRDKCPGCQSDDERERRAGKKYLVNALQDGYVNLWMLPASTWDSLDRYKDKSGGTILDRDYTIIKNVGDRTSYDVDREERDRIDLAPYEEKKKDHQKMLVSAYAEVWGEVPSAEREEVKKVPATRKVTAAELDQMTSAEVADLDGRGNYGSQTSMREVMNEKDDSDLPPFKEPQPEQDQPVEEDSDEQEISEDQLRAMSAPQIKALFQQCGLEPPDTDDVAVLADKLIELLS